MRSLHVAAFVSLDGVMQAPGGPDEDRSGGFDSGGWTVPFHDPAAGEIIADYFRDVALLVGRRTYDIFAGYWPNQAGEPFADHLNAIPKYVATRSPGPLDWTNSQALGPDAVAAVRALKATPGPDLLTQGSSDLLSSLFASDVVDRITTLTFPVLLGRGKRLFEPDLTPAGLKLADSRTTGTGVVIARYERDGAVRTGSF